jgi:hypothetical protein
MPTLLLRMLIRLGLIGAISGLSAYGITYILLVMFVSAQTASVGAISASLVAALFGWALDSHFNITRGLWDSTCKRELERIGWLFTTGVLDYQQSLIRAIKIQFDVAAGPIVFDFIADKQAKRLKNERLWLAENVLPLIYPHIKHTEANPLSDLNVWLRILDELKTVSTRKYTWLQKTFSQDKVAKLIAEDWMNLYWDQERTTVKLKI